MLDIAVAPTGTRKISTGAFQFDSHVIHGVNQFVRGASQTAQSVDQNDLFI